MEARMTRIEHNVSKMEGFLNQYKQARKKKLKEENGGGEVNTTRGVFLQQSEPPSIPAPNPTLVPNPYLVRERILGNQGHVDGVKEVEDEEVGSGEERGQECEVDEGIVGVEEEKQKETKEEKMEKNRNNKGQRNRDDDSRKRSKSLKGCEKDGQ